MISVLCVGVAVLYKKGLDASFGEEVITGSRRVVPVVTVDEGNVVGAVEDTGIDGVELSNA